MTALRIVIVDDEPLALDRLKVMLAKIEDVAIVDQATGCESGIAAIIQNEPDLVFLDIQMRDGTAFELLSQLPPEITPLVAFVTAYPKYMFEAFELEALDYVLKPAQLDKLANVVLRARRRIDLMSSKERVEELTRVVAELQRHRMHTGRPPHRNDIWIRHKGTQHVRVPVDDIEWISMQDDYACLHVNGSEHLLRISLDKLMQSLDPASFVRIHRSYVVRVDKVERVRLKGLGVREAVLKDGTRLPIGRIHARNLPWRSSRWVADEAM